MTGRACRLVAAVALASLPVWSAPAADAVTPPVVDDARLPAPRPPSPPEPTEQRQQCVSSTATTRPENPTQLQGLDLEAVWRLSRGAGQTVAVIDTGVARHRLLPRLVPGGDYVSTGDGTDDCDGHGTVVAGIIAASDNRGEFTGVAPDATIIGIRQSSVKFAPEGQSAPGFGDVNTLAMAVRTAADLGATVINISSIACVDAADPPDDRALGAAMEYAVEVKNAVVVAAAGNVGGLGHCPDQNPADPSRAGQPDWESVKVIVSPAWYDDYVLTVGSIDPQGAPSTFTLAGPWVDVAAPGEAVISLDADGEGLVDTLPVLGEPMPIMGTSYAAPVVSGIAALVRARSPHLTARQVMRRIEDTAHRPPSGWDPFVGNGVVDALAAVTGEPSAARMDVVTPPRPEETTVGPPVSDPPDTGARRVAFSGAGVCVAVAAAAITMTATVGWSRRRTDTVVRD